jgi:hypothetical protein
LKRRVKKNNATISIPEINTYGLIPSREKTIKKARKTTVYPKSGCKAMRSAGKRIKADDVKNTEVF